MITNNNHNELIKDFKRVKGIVTMRLEISNVNDVECLLNLEQLDLGKRIIGTGYLNDNNSCSTDHEEHRVKQSHLGLKLDSQIKSTILLLVVRKTEDFLVHE